MLFDFHKDDNKIEVHGAVCMIYLQGAGFAFALRSNASLLEVDLNAALALTLLFFPVAFITVITCWKRKYNLKQLFLNQYSITTNRGNSGGSRISKMCIHSFVTFSNL